MSTTTLLPPIATLRFDADTVHIKRGDTIVATILAEQDGGHGLYLPDDRKVTTETFETVKGAVDYYRDMVG